MQVLEGLQERLAGKQEALHKLGDALALLDMLQSLAQAASLSAEDYCRPKVSQAGGLSC
jgi:DNA mismatch repair ATPase MutS